MDGAAGAMSSSHPEAGTDHAIDRVDRLIVGEAAAPADWAEANWQAPARRRRPRRGKGEQVAIVAATETALALQNKLAADPRARTEIVGIYDDRLARRTSAAEQLAVEGSVDELIAYAREHRLDHIILALPTSAKARVDYYAARLRSLPVEITIVQDPSELALDAEGKVRWMLGEKLIVLQDRPISRFGIAVKRAMDVVIAGTALLLAAPVLVLACAAIRLESKGGVLFRQDRIGFNNRPFTVLKLRTMAVGAAGGDGSQQAVRNDPRVTRVGAILRRTSVDELPQLLNVLRGEMSLVGPRPQAVNMRIGDRRYSEAVAEYVERHKVRPGLTGWAQINGTRRGIYTLEQAAWAVSLDLHYVQNWSLWLDLKILLRTAGMVITGRDAL